MQFQNKKILLISPEWWGKSFVSKHHYATALAELGNAVFFLNPPSAGWKKTPVATGLTVLDYKNTYRGLGKMPRFLSALLTKRAFLEIERFAGVQFDLLWNFDSSRFFNLKQLPQRVFKIQHIVDLTENFQRDLGAETSDLCLSTTDFIKAAQQVHNPNSFKIHHGAHAENFGAERKDLGVEIKESVTVGYVGNLSIKYIDWETVFEMAQQNTDVGFVFIGPVGKSNLSNSAAIDPFLVQTQQLPNAYFLGAKPSTDIPGLLLNFDILLVVYKAKAYKEQLASPHKFMEYLASGKVILSSYTDEYKDKRSLLVMLDDNEALPDTLHTLKTELATYNSPEAQAARKAFAAQHSYKNQLQLIASKIIE